MVTHRFEFRDTIYNKIVVYNGPVFTPRLNETPLAISPPVKGENWSFSYLSSNAYHFDGLYIRNGKLISPQRFAWDNFQSNHDFVTHTGDPKKNDSYFCYRDTLYALLGNSGNSLQPHLHFQVTDGPDIWNSTGIPVVLKHYVKTAVYQPPWAFITPESFNNALMEGNYLVKVE